MLLYLTVEAEQSYVEDDQTSLPDLTSGYQEPAPNDQYDEFWNEQNNNG